MTKQLTKGQQEQRWNRLPQWAKLRITKLEADVEYWERAASEGPEDSDTFLSQGIGLGKPLGKHSEIDFMFGNNARSRISVRHHGDDGLYISGWGPVVVRPHASNGLMVKLEEQ